ncbi:hypothetical protein EHP00_2068 [Ecytonucleospora hepatopenaei]|uniref:Uncharacterized protein n=1 Tax=Ecytonucleospora hepatopenaei TaxID=646526 RepID=A0A1W0E4S5_9MICR|nr:hypothetical protein EHP00_2068 [Ecytonucleospora hepatopenaei]
MLFVQLGREVAMRQLKHRDEKGVITGIIDNKFVVIVKQDRSSEVVRVDDFVLNDKVYSFESSSVSNTNDNDNNSNITVDTGKRIIKTLESEGFFNKNNTVKKEEMSDFERYKITIRDKVAEKIIKNY